MTHWGWFWLSKNKRYERKKLCENLITIDSFGMFQKHIIPHLYIDMVCLEVPRFDLKLIFKGNYYEAKLYSVATYTIPIERQKCNYGGFRYFFNCPKCNKRMRILYCLNAIFLCRKCANLGYFIQRLRPTSRYSHISKKIKEKVVNYAGNLDLFKKPPRMHNSTFEMLRSKQFYYESKSNQAYNMDLRNWYGPKIESHLDGFFDYVDETKEWRKKPKSK